MDREYELTRTIVDTWVPTFIYQFFVENADSRQSVIDFVCQHRHGTNPRLGDPYRYGSYNFNIEIIFDGGIALFGFPIPGVVVYPDEKVKAEVATIRYLADYAAIPVPHIHHWATAARNPTGLRVPFIVMDHIPHATSIGQALEDPNFTIPDIPDSEKREYLYQQMAKISLQLYSLTSDRIGSLGVRENGEYTVTSAPLSHNNAYQVVNCSVPVAVLPARDKTYSSSTEYFTDSANMAIAALLFVKENFIKSETDCRDIFVASCPVRDMVRRRQNSTGESDQPIPEAEAQTDQPHETFRLWGDGFRPDNVLLDENGAVVGVVDWEYTYFAPETYWVNPPWWLPAELMDDDYIDKDAGSRTSDQEESPHDAEKEKEEQGDGSFREQWDELMRTYGGVRPYHLFSSGLPSLLDNYFWDYIDESFLGENAVGGHKGRLELLDDLCRMLMDWFVHRRVEERQKWDPKALMDQVLGQIDGKSWALAAKGDLRQD
ncbi:Altered inheritance of mitochondria protein 9 [Diaporthe eres]|nr:Altered inheritance of mitochondria protein 9 [Diaporthe eres]